MKKHEKGEPLKKGRDPKDKVFSYCYLSFICIYTIAQNEANIFKDTDTLDVEQLQYCENTICFNYS